MIYQNAVSRELARPLVPNAVRPNGLDRTLQFKRTEPESAESESRTTSKLLYFLLRRFLELPGPEFAIDDSRFSVRIARPEGPMPITPRDKQRLEELYSEHDRTFGG